MLPLLETALSYSLIGAAVLFLAALLGSLFSIGKMGKSIAQHFAAGVVFAAVCRELIPKVLAEKNTLDLVVGFSIGVIFMLLVGVFAHSLQDKKGKGSMGMLAGIGIDFWIDGILIGVAFLAGRQSGILIAIALTIEALFLGLSIAGVLKRSRPLSRIGTPLLLALMLPLGVLCGVGALSFLPEAYFLATLSFGIAALLYLVTEELLTAAHKGPEPAWVSATFFAGFLIILVI